MKARPMDLAIFIVITFLVIGVLYNYYLHLVSEKFDAELKMVNEMTFDELVTYIEDHLHNKPAAFIWSTALNRARLLMDYHQSLEAQTRLKTAVWSTAEGMVIDRIETLESEAIKGLRKTA